MMDASSLSWHGVAHKLGQPVAPSTGAMSNSSASYHVSTYTIPGGSALGSGNCWLDAKQVINNPSNSPAPYQRGVDWSYGYQNDPSSYPGINAPAGSAQVTRDWTTHLATVNVTVNYGRGWARNTQVTKAPGVTAFTLSDEIDFFNNGVDCTDPHDSIRGAWGTLYAMGNPGDTPQTVLLKLLGGGAGTHYFVHADAGAIAPGGRILSSDDDVIVECAGQAVSLLQIIMATKKALGIA